MSNRLLLLPFLLLISTTSLIAQRGGTVVVFSDKLFYLWINGELQNEVPQRGMTVQDLRFEYYTIGVRFANPQLGEFSENYVSIPLAFQTDYQIVRYRGRWTLRQISSMPLGPPIATRPPQNPPSNQQPPTNNNDINININIGNTQVGNNTQTTPPGSVVLPPGNQLPPPAPVYVPGYNGPIGCPVPMETFQFSQVKRSIDEKAFEQSKLTIAKQVLANNCLTSAQVQELLGQFTFESTRLEFAKFCYGRTHDIGNYYVVNDAFDFESSIDELNEYIQAQPAIQTVPTEPDPRANQQYIYSQPQAQGRSVQQPCFAPMDEGTFAVARNSVQRQSLSDSKLKVAKQIVGTNCVLSSQVASLMDIFSLERHRLELAKYAYDFVFDPGNYFQVNNHLTFRRSVEELDEYLQGRR
ncbi:MAG: DUF4476 domain-containing protein [Bacteroidota bacterium]